MGWSKAEGCGSDGFARMGSFEWSSEFNGGELEHGFAGHE